MNTHNDRLPMFAGDSIPLPDVRGFGRMIFDPVWAERAHPASAGHEILHVVAGRMDLVLGDRRYAIGPGDALLFEASVPHAWCNPTWQRSRFLLVLEAEDNVGGQLLPHLDQ